MWTYRPGKPSAGERTTLDRPIAETLKAATWIASMPSCTLEF
jgi:hypothetical protein